MAGVLVPLTMGAAALAMAVLVLVTAIFLKPRQNPRWGTRTKYISLILGEFNFSFHSLK